MSKNIKNADVFERLIRLWSDSRTPTEDFCTECLAGILDTYKLTDKFVNEVLVLGGQGYSLTTQKHYSKEKNEEFDSFVDMVFENLDSICFVENKVESHEGLKVGEDGHEIFQLEKYALILNRKYGEKKCKLVYCTKYHEDKTKYLEDENANGEEKFRQIKWKDIANFLIKQYDNSHEEILNCFVKFLNKRGMTNYNLTCVDVTHMQYLGQLMNKTVLFLEDLSDRYIRKEFKVKKPTIKFDSSLKYTLTFNYGGFGEIGAGYYFRDGKFNFCVYVWDNKSVKLLQYNLSEDFKCDGNDLYWIQDVDNSEEYSDVEIFKLFEGKLNQIKNAINCYNGDIS